MQGIKARLGWKFFAEMVFQQKMPFLSKLKYFEKYVDFDNLGEEKLKTKHVNHWNGLFQFCILNNIHCFLDSKHF